MTQVGLFVELRIVLNVGVVNRLGYNQYIDVVLTHWLTEVSLAGDTFSFKRIDLLVELLLVFDFGCPFYQFLKNCMRWQYRDLAWALLDELFEVFSAFTLQ